MPSLVNGRAMNSYEFDRGPNRVNGALSDGFDNYRDDPYAREDMRRDEEDRYRQGARNRFNTDYLDQNSLSDFRSNEPKFELDHLATFAAGTRNGCIHAEDGLRKLRQMENTTGIWTMRCVLIVERNYLVILDNSTLEELERFPVQLVQDPTAIFKNDRREIYNNLILFTIVDDPKKRSSQADMHIFQSCKAPAQEIVDEILASQGGQQRVHPAGGGSSSMVIYQTSKNYRSKIPPPPVVPAPEPPNSTYDFQGMRDFFDSRTYNTAETRQFNQTSYSQGGQFGGPISQQRSLITRINPRMDKDEINGGGSNEILERDVQLLNHCFDDIEKFVARLQQAAESYKELEKRKRERAAKNKKKQSGDGMLNARARPPPDNDFVDIFQKFKLSFNLLAKLKAHIHDPNAPELVHFLFTPLSLIYEASRDPYHGNQNLGDQAVAPVLTADAKQLLLNCLTSKEIEMWQSLGKHWTTSRAEWNGNIPGYVPEFYDGWNPGASVIEELTQRTALISGPSMPDTGRSSVYSQQQRPIPFPDEDRGPVMDRTYRNHDEYNNRFEQRSFETRERGGGYDPPPPRSYEPSPRGFEPAPSQGFELLPSSRGFEPASVGPRGFESHSRERSPPRSGMHSPFSDFVEQPTLPSDRVGRPEPQRVETHHLVTPMSRQAENAAYFEELRRSGDAEIYEAAHDRTGKNAKELTVQKGDVLQVLDRSKNWWKLRNFNKEVGFAPYTILKPAKTEDDNPIPNGVPSLYRAGTSEYSYDDNASKRGAPSRRDHEPPSDRHAYRRYHLEDSRGPGPAPAPAPYRQFDNSATNQRLRAEPPSNQSPNSGGRSHAHMWRSREPSPSRPSPRQRSPTASTETSEIPPPPPIPAESERPLYAQEGSKYVVDLKPVGAKGKTSKDHLQEELHNKLTSRHHRPPRHLVADAPMRLDIKSSPHEVSEWLQMKGFSEATQEAFWGYTGREMFHLHLTQLQRMLGHDEAIRLDGLLTLQKNTSGYATQSSKELNAILQRRKEHVNSLGWLTGDTQDALPPDYGGGASLKDQLVRQRSQLRQSQMDLDLY
ncbi:epidermal growth factor receptor kinase substrate 8 [Aplysia californica]|uniref:Epidermal growth factor receptor kinase substrate 8 n=1 Tax=Aplysia californica TaxID=6500 RepID=A0ABM1A317_APLCA|nr:epidermal growth factor receptor kinase substrate 8 [Aplysia californica]